MKNIAMILSGCGHLDGAEIRETVLSLLYLDQGGVSVSIFAPDMNQHHLMNHMKGDQGQGERNVLEEAARLARGDIQPLTALDMANFDGLILPGGYGAAKNLSDFAFKGGNCSVLPDVKNAITACVQAGKPLAAVCIAPAIVAAALEGIVHATLTIGDDADTAAAIESCGHHHQNCATDDCVVDEAHKIVTCSAYMREDAISDIAQGIKKTVEQLIHWS